MKKLLSHTRVESEISTLRRRDFARRNSRGAANAPACVEPIEARRLFAVGGSIELVGTHVEATGTDFTDEENRIGGDDVMRIERVGTDDVKITVNDISRTFDMDDVTSYALRGGSGPDQITKASNDIRGSVTLEGGPAGYISDGHDVLTGTDAVFIRGDSIREPNGTEVAFFRDDERLLGILGTEGDNRITVRDDLRAPTVSIDSGFFGRFLFDDTFYRGYLVHGNAGNDTLGIDSTWGGYVFGDDGNDLVVLTEKQRSIVHAGAGDDLVRIAGGPEFYREGFITNLPEYWGGEGSDTVELDRQGGVDLRVYESVENVNNAHGLVYGNSLNNRITAAVGDTRTLTADAAEGNDVIVGGWSNDHLSGGEGDDTITGDTGDDFLDGGPGTDFLDGGYGNDTEINGENGPPPPPPPPPSGPQAFIAADGTLTANGTAADDNVSVVRVGTDDVRVTINGNVWTFDMDDFGKIRLSGLDGNDTMSAGTGVADVVMLGGAGDDRLTGNELNGEFFGGADNDIVDAFGGADAVHGDGGNDTLNAGAGNDYMEGDAGDDTLTGGSGADTMLGGDGNDTFYARDSVADTLYGNLGTDRAQRDSIDSINSIEQNIA